MLGYSRGVAVLAALAALGAAPPVEPPDIEKNGLAPPVARPPDVTAVEVGRLVEGNREFAVELYGAVRQSPGNVFLSPHSISAALAMSFGGARGETEAEMARTLRFRLDQHRLHAAFAALQADLHEGAAAGDYQWHAANRLWGQRDYGILPAYRELTERYYGAPLEEVDFRSASEAARQAINRWVELQTQERIRDILPYGSLSADTRLVLANAVYFFGNWEKPFSTVGTRPAPFFVAPGEAVEVPLMYRLGHYRYAARDGVQLVEIPYRGGRLAMVVVLPAERFGLAEVERQLTAARLEEWIGASRSRRVRIRLPRFRVEAAYRLGEPLGQLGLRQVFGPGADLTGMSPRGDLFLGEVYHKAFVEVNEHGTEAAAATVPEAPMAEPGPPPPPPIEFRADHPFLFILRDRKSGSILFLGRLANPAALVE